MKKRLKFMIILIVAFSLTGCMQKYNYTEDESNSIAEYMAGKLLEEDKNYDQKLIVNEEVLSGETSSKGNVESPVVVDESGSVSKPEGEGGRKDETGVQASETLSSILGGKSFHVNYKSYTLAEVYPEEGQNPYFSLTAREGYQFLVVSFDVTNKTKQGKNFNLSNIDVDYQLDANVGTVYKPQFTLLENDLRYIDVIVDENKSTEALLVFEVSKEIDTSNMKLTVTKDEKTTTIKIK